MYVTLVGEQRLTYAAKPPGDPEDGRPLHRSHCQEVVRSGRSFVVTGATSDEALRPTDGPPIAYAGSPIGVEGGAVVGVLCACDDQPHQWTADDLRVLDRYADRAGRRLLEPVARN